MNYLRLFLLIAATGTLLFIYYVSNHSGTNQSTDTTALAEFTEFETIRLSEPDLNNPATLMTALKNRRSERDFKSEKLTFQQLSSLLWAANGLNRDNDTVRTTAPSARALYPVEIYAVLPNGIYRYNKQGHTLEPIVEGNYMEQTGIQSFVKEAPLNILYIADLSKNPNFTYAAIDAGHNSQNVYLYCAATGLKSVTRGSADGEVLLKTLQLDPEQHKFILAQTVGK